MKKITLKQTKEMLEMLKRVGGLCKVTDKAKMCEVIDEYESLKETIEKQQAFIKELMKFALAFNDWTYCQYPDEHEEFRDDREAFAILVNSPQWKEMEEE